MEYIDMHSHILPGLDDGSKNMDMTLAMLRVAEEEGIRTIYTTPHCMPGKGHPTLAKVEEKIHLVQEMAAAEGIQITLKKGTEYYYIEEMSEWMEEGKIITLGDSNCVLVEFEPYAEEKYIHNAVREILGFGYQPVIAHVDRYLDWYTREDYAALFSFSDCLYQINMEALADRAARKFVLRLAKEGYPLLPGSDAHNTEKRRPNFDEAELLFRKNSLTPLLSALEAGMEQAGFRV